MTKIYITGKISGIEDTARKLFQEAETKLTQKGYTVVNPMKLPHNHDKTWKSYMKEDIKALMDCDEIYALNNWEKSEGATIEIKIAQAIGIKVILQPEL